jgi:hypothetical protein
VLALCKCGRDLTDHDLDGCYGDVIDCVFDAAGTKYHCAEPVDGYLCPRPRYHKEEGVPCGPLTGKKLW